MVKPEEGTAQMQQSDSRGEKRVSEKGPNSST